MKTQKYIFAIADVAKNGEMIVRGHTLEDKELRYRNYPSGITASKKIMQLYALGIGSNLFQRLGTNPVPMSIGQGFETYSGRFDRFKQVIIVQKRIFASTDDKVLRRAREMKPGNDAEGAVRNLEDSLTDTFSNLDDLEESEEDDDIINGFEEKPSRLRVYYGKPGENDNILGFMEEDESEEERSNYEALSRAIKETRTSSSTRINLDCEHAIYLDWPALLARVPKPRKPLASMIQKKENSREYSSPESTPYNGGRGRDVIPHNIPRPEKERGPITPKPGLIGEQN